jgi:hypothetical protein
MVDSACTLGKRTSGEAGLSQDGQSSKRIAVAGGGRAGGGGQGSGGPANCPRAGDAPRAAQHRSSRERIAGTVEGIRAQIESAEEPVDDSPPKTKKGAKPKPCWNTLGVPPNATRECARRLVQLGMIPLSVNLQTKLERLLGELYADSNNLSPIRVNSASVDATSLPTDDAPSPFVAAMRRCAVLEARSSKYDFDLMMSYIQAALYIQW